MSVVPHSEFLASLDHNMPILVVDDYPSMRRIVKNCLRQLGFDNVTEAEDAPSALQKLTEGTFQLVISDWSLPEMSASSFLEELHTNSKLQKVPVLVVAAEAERTQTCTLQEKKIASGVLMKPFTTSILQKKMEEVLKPS